MFSLSIAGNGSGLKALPDIPETNPGFTRRTEVVMEPAPENC